MRRGEGIGRALVTAAEDALLEMGCPKVQLMVRPDNADVLGFYDTLGYERFDTSDHGQAPHHRLSRQAALTRDLNWGMPQTLAFTKGHGTGNDFVVIPDPDGELELTDDQVAVLCDRRFGIGADGILRVVPSTAIDEGADAAASGAEWFMDYRNADGSKAEMCGNGIRVFARYLAEAGWATLDGRRSRSAPVRA